jgi:hypothetical protein
MRHVFPICGLQGLDPIRHPCQLLERRSSGTSNPLRVGMVAQYRFLEHPLYPPGLFFGGLRHKESVYVTVSRKLRVRTRLAQLPSPSMEPFLGRVALAMKPPTDLLPRPAVQVEADDEPQIVRRGQSVDIQAGFAGTRVIP